MHHASRSIAASTTLTANALRPAPQVRRARLVAAVATLAGVLALLPAACSSVNVACDPPTFAIRAEPEDLAEHCALAVAAACQRAFADCPDIGVYTIEYPNVETCTAEAPQDFCDVGQWSDSYLDDEVGTACLAALPNVACAEFDQEGGPKACWNVERPVPPDPSGCELVAPGSHRGALDTAVSNAWGRFAALYCVCLEKGDRITLRVAHGDLDQPRIHLFSPAGEPVAHIDSEGPLRATAPANGSYLVLVSESAVSLKGQPVTVTIDVE